MVALLLLLGLPVAVAALLLLGLALAAAVLTADTAAATAAAGGTAGRTAGHLYNEYREKNRRSPRAKGKVARTRPPLAGVQDEASSD